MNKLFAIKAYKKLHHQKQNIIAQKYHIFIILTDNIINDKKVCKNSIEKKIY